jgi:hypothetical protein
VGEDRRRGDEGGGVLEPDEEYAEDVRGVVTGVILREEGDEARGKRADRARPRLCLY